MSENKKELIDNIGNIASQLGGVVSNVISAVNQNRQSQAAQKGVAISGSYSDGNSMPSWLLPVGVGIAGLGILFLIFKN